MKGQIKNVIIYMMGTQCMSKLYMVGILKFHHMALNVYLFRTFLEYFSFMSSWQQFIYRDQRLVITE